MIIFEGPSQIDGKPVVAIATENSSNTKTGSMVQTWILLSEVDPITGNREGLDQSICGNCPHKGITDPAKSSGTAPRRSCYVALFGGPYAVWRAYRAGKYKRASLQDLPALGHHKTIRVGAYGDPAAVPIDVWRALLSKSVGHTGYTHQIADFPQLSDFCMVSADSHAEARAAWSNGQRTYRVLTDISELDKENEVLCPASAEAGRRTTCLQCRLCSGSAGFARNARSIAIVSHGSGRKNFARNMKQEAQEGGNE